MNGKSRSIFMTVIFLVLVTILVPDKVTYGLERGYYSHAFGLSVWGEKRLANELKYSQWPNKYSSMVVRFDQKYLFGDFQIQEKLKHRVTTDSISGKSFCIEGAVKIKKKETSCELEFIVAENAQIAQNLYLRRLTSAQFNTSMTTLPKPYVIRGLGDHGCRMGGGIYFVRYNLCFFYRCDYGVDINQVEDILLVLDKKLMDRAQPAQKKALLDNIKSFDPPKIFYVFRDTPVSLKVQETASMKGVLFAPWETKLTKEGVLFNFRVPGQHKLHLAIYNKDTFEFAAIEKKFEVKRKPFPGGPEIASYQIPTEMIQGQWYPVRVTIKSPKGIGYISWRGEGFVFKTQKGERKEDNFYGDVSALWVKATSPWLRRHQIVVRVTQDGKKDAIAVTIKVHPK